MPRGILDKIRRVMAELTGLGGDEHARPASEGSSDRELRLYLPLAGERVWVGTLGRDGDEYTFRYSEAFRRRRDLPSLPAFPDMTKEYRSPDLFPFFLARLPPIGRPDVERFVAEHHIDPADTLRLLSVLGRKTITSPYEFDAIDKASLAPA
jgi:HipA-like protein